MDRKTTRPARTGIAASCLAIVSIVFSTACEKAAAPKAATAPEVEVVTVQQRDVPIHKEWLGSLDGNINATIRPQVTGYLIRQNYREGDFVRKGQILFEIDPSTFKVAVDQASAALDQKQAMYVNSTATLARARPLAEKNAVSRKDLDDAVSNELSARAAVDQASAALETHKLNLGFTRIASPIDGIAGIAKAQLGDLLSPSSQTELTTVSSVDPIKVYINLSEREYLAFQKNGGPARSEQMPLELILVDGSIYPHPGKFTLLNRQVDATTGTFQVGALFPNRDMRLRPGQSVRLRATTSVLKDALLVPQRAVTEIQGKYLIAIVSDDNKVDFRLVKPGERVGSDWVISAGLKAGEKVVAEGTQKARPGSVVRTKPFAAHAAGAEKPETKSATPAAHPAAPAAKG